MKIRTKRLYPIYQAVLFLSFIALAFYSCKKDSDDAGSGTPGTNEVWMQSSAFSPSTITVAVNTTITWTNKDGMTHTITSDSGLFNSGNMGNGGTFTRQFTAAGTFPYHCNLHSGMKAKVVVQ